MKYGYPFDLRSVRKRNSASAATTSRAMPSMQALAINPLRFKSLDRVLSA
jgi:hypothetical protein